MAHRHPTSEPRIYRGVFIWRCSPNSSGMRWHTVGSVHGGNLKADTLDGIKALIRHDQGITTRVQSLNTNGRTAR